MCQALYRNTQEIQTDTVPNPPGAYVLVWETDNIQINADHFSSGIKKMKQHDMIMTG